MTEPQCVPFLMPIPVFALASNYNTNESGGIVLDEHIRFIAPQMETGQYIAIFTDHDLASSFLLDAQNAPIVKILACPTQPSLTTLLDHLAEHHEYILCDPNPKTGIGRLLLIADLLDELDALEQGPSSP